MHRYRQAFKLFNAFATLAFQGTDKLGGQGVIDSFLRQADRAGTGNAQQR